MLHIPHAIFLFFRKIIHAQIFHAQGKGKETLVQERKLMIPPALLPISKLGASGVPITLPRGATTRWRAFKRTMRLCRTGTNTSATLMRRRRRFNNLFSRRGSPRGWKERRTILRRARRIQRQTRFFTRDPLRRTSKILRVQRRGKGK